MNFKHVPIEDHSSYSNLIFSIQYFAPVDQLGLIEENKKSLRLYDALNLHYVNEITFQKCTINCVCFIPQYFAFAILGSDKHLYFYSSDDLKLVRKVQLPENQNEIVYYSSKKMLLSFGITGLIYGWDMEQVFSEEFGNLMKDNKQTYGHILSPNTPL